MVDMNNIVIANVSQLNVFRNLQNIHNKQVTKKTFFKTNIHVHFE